MVGSDFYCVGRGTKSWVLSPLPPQGGQDDLREHGGEVWGTVLYRSPWCGCNRHYVTASVNEDSDEVGRESVSMENRAGLEVIGVHKLSCV